MKCLKGVINVRLTTSSWENLEILKKEQIEYLFQPSALPSPQFRTHFEFTDKLISVNSDVVGQMPST